MKALVVYDSFFGNAEKVALAMGQALGSPEEVTVLRVDAVRPEVFAGIGALIVGSPTRLFRPTRAIAQMLKALPAETLRGVRVAGFDTRIQMEDINSGLLRAVVRVLGHASKPIADRLQQKGGNLVLAPEGFGVKDSEGPLKDGELERAAAWARRMLVD